MVYVRESCDFPSVEGRLKPLEDHSTEKKTVRSLRETNSHLKIATTRRVIGYTGGLVVNVSSSGPGAPGLSPSEVVMWCFFLQQLFGAVTT